MEQESDGTQNPPLGSFQAPELATLSGLLPAYEFRELIACGGMGAVYRVRQLSLGRDVAIKVLPPELSRFEEFEQGFKVEARAMAQLKHSNLIGVYDFGEVAGMLYLVMEFVGGQSLYHATTGQVVDPIQAVEIVQGVAAGLGEAHKHGIVHRDIKPANILLTRRLKPKLGDFGLAVPADNVAAGMNMGTPGYVAPEVHENFESASPASDVFSLGMILHELLSGLTPTGELEPDLNLIPNLRGLRVLVAKAIAPKPTQRHLNGEVMAKALGEWLVEAKNLPPHLLTNPTRPATPVALRAPQPVPLPATSGSRGMALPLAGLAAVIVLIGGLLVIFTGEDDDPKPTGNNSDPSASPLPNSNPPGLGNNPATDGEDHARFNLKAHQEAMRASLSVARAQLIESRHANIKALKEDAAQTEAWKAYFALVHEEYGELPRFLPENSKIAIDKATAELLNAFAIKAQERIDQRHEKAIEEIHQKSVAALKKAKALPREDVSSRWEAWVEWLGKSPLHLLAINPHGQWDLSLGPPEQKGTTITIGHGPTVAITQKSTKSAGTLSLSSDGQIKIVRNGNSGSWKLRWRPSGLEGANERGQQVRFRRKSFRFVASATTPDPKVPPVVGVPNEKPLDDPLTPDDPPLDDKEFAQLRADFRAKLRDDLEPFVKSYLAYLDREHEKANRRGAGGEAAQIEAELDRVKILDWPRGLLFEPDLRGDTPIPAAMKRFREKFEDHLIATIGTRQADYSKKLKSLRAKHEKAGHDTTEVDEELEPFLKRRRIDLAKFYNARPVAGVWTNTSARGLASAMTTLRSNQTGMAYEISGILQLNSGTYQNRQSRMFGKDVNEKYEKNWPYEVTGIPVHQKANRIYLVGGLIWGRAERGTTVARAVLHYEDGSTKKLLLKEKENIGDWHKGNGVPGAHRLWRGPDTRAVYETGFDNPQPDLTITTIDLVSDKDAAGPFFLAITLGD